LRKPYSFKIEGKTFHVLSEPQKLTHFTVKSVPRPYAVSWDNGKDPIRLINKAMNDNPANVMLIDEKIYSLYGRRFKFSRQRMFRARATESFKTLKGVVDVIDFLQEKNITKGETLIVVGGGIIQDVAAFVCASYKRGIPWIYFPTTLLSMCDSCIGGKTGINHNNAKNQLALFSAPAKVIINSNFLKTLDNFAIRSGMGEILKLLVTGGPKLFDLYQRYVTNGKVLNFHSYKPLIFGSLSVKKAIVEEDEFELNLRKSLNFGHTIGHAIEVLSKYKIPHGQAVAIGMMIVNDLSAQIKWLNVEQNSELKELSFRLLDNKIKNIMSRLPTAKLKALLKKDKKTLGNYVTLVMLKSIGDMRFKRFCLDEKFLINIISTIKRDFCC